MCVAVAVCVWVPYFLDPLASPPQPQIDKTIAGDGYKGFRDGLAEKARFSCPTGIAVGPLGDVFVAGLCMPAASSSKR